MPERTKVRWVYIISMIFVMLNAYLMIRDVYWALFIPVLLILLFMFFYSMDKILLLVAFLTPLAINMQDSEFGIGISLPTEPLLFGVLLIFIIRLLYQNEYDKNILKHPLTILIILDLVWIFITSLTSQLPLVSFKFLIARLWFVIPFYFLGVVLFKKIKNIRAFIWLYAIALLVVIFYTIYNHSQWGFDEQAGHWVMEPFYNDHTAYGAILALFIPVFLGFSLSRAYNKTYRFISFLVFLILVVAIVLSFSRAAWISLVFALGIYLLIAFRIKIKLVILVLAVLIGTFLLFQNEIFDRLEKNKQGSSADLMEHLQSISNISTDDSNLERINRWQSALRMFADKPFIGFGPGTYQFEYAPFQHSEEKTLISTNFGDRGNAHSEYIGPLAERGFPGFILTVLILIFTIFTGLKVYKNAKEKEVRLLSLVILLSLITYFLHGTLNNFLDTDKASIPYWGFIAILVSLDIYS
ncbi:MAG TPA: O-antigen ligase family protein, partial [Bacteroidales bacterium]|nr:O-antigen ligase family protein [Bacteroidales bacterium]